MKVQLWEVYIPTSPDEVIATHEIYIPVSELSFGMTGIHQTDPERYSGDDTTLVKEVDLPEEAVPLLNTIKEGKVAEEKLGEIFTGLFEELNEEKDDSILLTDKPGLILDGELPDDFEFGFGNERLN